MNSGIRALSALAALFAAAAPLSAAVAIKGVGRYQFTINGSTASELSGISYAGGSKYYAISDNDSKLYPLNIGLNLTTGAMTSLSIGSSLQLRDPKGNALSGVDFEGVAYNA